MEDDTTARRDERDPSLATDGGERSDARTDGGAQAFFEQTNDVDIPDVSQRDRALRYLDRYVLAPLRVAWSDWRARVGLGIIVFIVLLGTLGVMFYPKPEVNMAEPYLSWFQNWKYPLGTDNMGRPIDRQLVHSTPSILKMAAAGVMFSIGLAVVIGVVAGYRGGRVDYVLMNLTDIVMIIPGLPLVIVIAAIYTPQDSFVVGVILAIDRWPGLARALRSQVLTIRHESYVEAARSMGVPTSYVVLKDITPQLMPYIMINAANAARGVIFAAVGLYFLGFLPFAEDNWGVMMNQAYSTGGALANFPRAGHWLIPPMFMLTLLSFGLILFSQGMDRVFNTKIRARHAATVDADEEEDVVE